MSHGIRAQKHQKIFMWTKIQLQFENRRKRKSVRKSERKRRRINTKKKNEKKKKSINKHKKRENEGKRRREKEKKKKNKKRKTRKEEKVRNALLRLSCVTRPNPSLDLPPPTSYSKRLL